jgi:uncharacterized protein YoxC
VSIIEKIVHWFSPPEDTCAKGPTLEESVEARQEWRNEIHGNRQEVQKMQALARQTQRVFTEVNKSAHKVTNDAQEFKKKSEEALRVAKCALERLNKENKNGKKP